VALCGVAGFGILFFGRIGQEERLMLETFGEQYDAFARAPSASCPGSIDGCRHTIAACLRHRRRALWLDRGQEPARHRHRERRLL